MNREVSIFGRARIFASRNRNAGNLLRWGKAKALNLRARAPSLRGASGAKGAERPNRAPPALPGEGTGQRSSDPTLAQLIEQREGVEHHGKPEQQLQAEKRREGHRGQAGRRAWKQRCFQDGGIRALSPVRSCEGANRWRVHHNRLDPGAGGGGCPVARSHQNPTS